MLCKRRYLSGLLVIWDASCSENFQKAFIASYDRGRAPLTFVKKSFEMRLSVRPMLGSTVKRSVLSSKHLLYIELSALTPALIVLGAIPWRALWKAHLFISVRGILCCVNAFSKSSRQTMCLKSEVSCKYVWMKFHWALRYCCMLDGLWSASSTN